MMFIFNKNIYKFNSQIIINLTVGFQVKDFESNKNKKLARNVKICIQM
jgi:hypothetical protein